MKTACERCHRGVGLRYRVNTIRLLICLGCVAGLRSEGKRVEAIS